MKRVLWVAESAKLADLVDRLGPEAAEALAEGRLFIGRKRARSTDELVPAGEVVVLHAPRNLTEGAFVLAEHDGIVAAFKPAGMATVPDHHGVAGSLLSVIERASGKRLHVTSRLDVGVSGAVLFASTDEARERLARAREQGTYLRQYLAIASAAPSPPQGLWNAPIGRAPNPRHRRIGGLSAKPAETRYRVIDTAPQGQALLAVRPITGRTHQIRVHAAHAGAPLLGDGVYGGPPRLVSPTGAVTRLSRIALHCHWVEVPATKGASLRVEAPIPDDFLAIWKAVGGSDEAIERAHERW